MLSSATYPESAETVDISAASGLAKFSLAGITDPSHNDLALLSAWVSSRKAEVKPLALVLSTFLLLPSDFLVAGSATLNQNPASNDGSTSANWNPGPAPANSTVLPAHLHDGHWYHTATLLNDGRVLLAGGSNYSSLTLDSAEVYDFATNVWNITGSLNVARTLHVAALLTDGRVLVAGGIDDRGFPSKIAELYDPATGTWSRTGSMITARRQAAAVRLPDGRVLVAGGISNFQGLATAELFDPVTGTWSATGALHRAHASFPATLLVDGRVLISGGIDQTGGKEHVAELYDPVTGTWTLTGFLALERSNHTQTLLPDGQVMALGGQGHSFGALASVDIYDPTTGIWRTARDFRPGRFDHTANMLGNSVLLAGGAAPDGYPISVGNFFDSVTGGSRKVKGLLLFKRSRHTGTSLLDGSVLIAGGYDGTFRELTATEILPR